MPKHNPKRNPLRLARQIRRQFLKEGRPLGISIQHQSAPKVKKGHLSRENWHEFASEDDFRSLPTSKIQEKLAEFGVMVTLDSFNQLAKTCYSAKEISQKWARCWSRRKWENCGNYLHAAAAVLWERLTPPGYLCSEQIDARMQVGHRKVLEVDSEGACQTWLPLWDALKQRFRQEMTSIEEAEAIFEGEDCIQDFTLDLMMEMHNAGLHEKRIEICKYIYTHFPKSDPSYLFDIKRDEAESFFYLGNIREGERHFQELTQQFPSEPWGYIGWGDRYEELYRETGRQEYFERSKFLYDQALKIPVQGDEGEDIQSIVKDRIVTLSQKTKRRTRS